MLNDQRTSYRWQDHVITSRRAVLNLLATALIAVVVGVAGLSGHNPASDPSTNVAAATERTPSLARSVKRPVLSHLRTWALKRC